MIYRVVALFIFFMMVDLSSKDKLGSGDSEAYTIAFFLVLAEISAFRQSRGQTDG